MAWINLENLKLYHNKLKEYIDNKIANENINLNNNLKSYSLVLEPNTSIVNLVPIIGSKQLLENSFIYVDGIKLIKDVHYNINKTNKTVIILNPYNHKVNFEVIIFN